MKENYKSRSYHVNVILQYHIYSYHQLSTYSVHVDCGVGL